VIQTLEDSGIRDKFQRFQKPPQPDTSVTKRDSIGIPTPAPPATPDVRYDPAAWDEECFAVFAEGRDPGACPQCGRTGFYGPRVGGRGRRYRACRFCGFHQDVGGLPDLARPTSHRCGVWPQVARAPYVWWLPPDEDEYLCPFCEERVRLEDARVRAPIDDPEHPWWKVPQERTRFYYARFWENWAFTKGRVFI